MAGLQTPSTSTPMLEINELRNIVDTYKCVNPHLVAIKLDKLVSGLPYSFSNVQFRASRTPNLSTFYDFQHFLKAAKAPETSSSFAADNPDLIDFSSVEYQEAVGRLKDCLSKENLNSITKIATMSENQLACDRAKKKTTSEKAKKETMSENQLAYGIAVHLIKKLAGGASVNRTKSAETCPCGCDDKVDSGSMWIGAPQVWHGELDIIGGSQATSVTSVATSATDQASEKEDVDVDEAPGDWANLEVKKDVTDTKICQILSQGIVFGWTEFNRHKNYSPYIPSIMIDSRKFMFVLYNPETDTLFSSEGFIHYFPFEDYFGLINLWMILNHRLFFIKRSIDYAAVEPCGFKTMMEEDLSKYQALIDYKQSITTPVTVVNNVELQPRISVRAGFKRRKFNN